MNTLTKGFSLIAVGFILSACGGGEDSAKRDAEVKKILQEATEKERKMYEGMQKSVENIQKSLQEKKQGE